MPAQKLNHPTFGPVEVIPSLVAIRWKRPIPSQAVRSLLSTQRLKLAKDAIKPQRGAPSGARDPRANSVNQSETLTWATGKITEAQRTKAVSNPDVAWVGRVYRATQAEAGPQSYFTVNPHLLLLTAPAADAVGEIQALDEQASIDSERGKLLKGMIAVYLPAGNALEVAQKANELAQSKGVSGGVMVENIPYVSPVCACGCSGSTIAVRERAGACSPPLQPFFPNDTFFPRQWNLPRVQAPRAWPLTKGDPNVVVAVLDQGVELAHPDMNLWPVSYSTISHMNDGSPVGNHGTACAGIIGARISNSLGVAGLAGECRVMAIATNFADTEVAEGLYYAADNGARVVSMSFGVYPSWMTWNFALIEAALQYCQDRNVVLPAASGNENLPVCRFPASDPRTIAVGGSNRDDVRKSIGDNSIEPGWGACYGPDLDVVAPCLEIPTTDRLGAAGYSPTDYYMRFNGTSAATPHVAALAGLIFSLNPGLSALDVRQIISQTTDKINTGPYIYAPTAGKPYGTWNNEVGYGRINAERALLVACTSAQDCTGAGPCAVGLPTPDPCCVSPCDPPWRPDEQCLVWYETRLFRAPIRDPRVGEIAAGAAAIEFRITYEHRLCLLGKQHGPLLYTLTLLPHEKVRLYHSDRYRRITSETQRFSVRTTFMQFLSLVHEARLTNTLDALSSKLASSSSSNSSSGGGGFFGGLFGFGGSESSASSKTTTDLSRLSVGFVSDEFNQSVQQSSQLTTAERSLVVSTYEDQESLDITVRTLENSNDCRTVTYFVRQIVELYALSTVVSDISYRILAPSVPPDWHSTSDLAWLPPQIQAQIRNLLALLPRVGAVVDKPRPISLPTDGAVYDPELAHCCSCEPEREASIRLQLELQKAAARKACAEAQILELELERRRLLLGKGDVSPFEHLAPPAPAEIP